MTDPFAVRWLRGWAALIGHRDRMRGRAEIEAMLSAAGLDLVGWERILGFSPLTTYYTVVGHQPSASNDRHRGG
ncbi:MAG: hypothetical protein ACLQHS_05165 [Candidatus Limnocylindrales bacterium]|jgi:hypothetical protein